MRSSLALHQSPLSTAIVKQNLIGAISHEISRDDCLPGSTPTRVAGIQIHPPCGIETNKIRLWRLRAMLMLSMIFLRQSFSALKVSAFKFILPWIAVIDKPRHFGVICDESGLFTFCQPPNFGSLLFGIHSLGISLSFV